MAKIATSNYIGTVGDITLKPFSDITNCANISDVALLAMLYLLLRIHIEYSVCLVDMN